MAPTLKEKGTAAFHAGKWEEAIKLYTNALKAGSLSDEEAGALYSNRAAAQIHLYRYDLGECSLCRFMRVLLMTRCIYQPFLTPHTRASSARHGLALSLGEQRRIVICIATISHFSRVSYFHRDRGSSLNRSPTDQEAISLEEDAPTRQRYEEASSVVRQRIETLADKTSALISEVESNDFCERYRDLVEKKDPRVERGEFKSAETAFYAYEVIEKAMLELDEQMIMSEDGTVEAVSPSPVLMIAGKPCASVLPSSRR